MDGVIVIDKPEGWTSHDVVNKVRRIAQTKKVGHLGTLDPIATGVLPLVIERATRGNPKPQPTDRTTPPQEDRVAGLPPGWHWPTRDRDQP